MNLRESLFRALDSLSESSIIHNGKKFSNVKRFDDDKSANDFLEKNPSHGVLHADKGGVYVTHNKNKGVKHTYTAHNEETEHLDENAPQHVPGKKWDENKEKWVAVKRPAFDPKKERGRPSTPDQGQKRSDFDEEADLTKIDTKRLQSMVQMHKHYGQKNPASKAAADRGEAELKSRMNKEEVEQISEISKALAAKAYHAFTAKGDEAYADKSEKGHADYKKTQRGRKAAYDKYHGNGKVAATEEVEDLDEAVNEKQIRKDLDSGMSHDVVIGKHANKGTTNTDAIRKVIKQHAWDKRMKKESVDLDEAKLSPEKQERLDSLISNVMMTTDPSYYGNDTHHKYLKAIEKEFGATIAKQVDDGSYKTHWGRDNQAHGHDKLSSRQWSSEFKGGPRVTAAGKMNKQDVSALKNRIKGDKRFGGLSKSVKLPEEVDLAEGRPSQAHPLAGHDYHKKSNDQLEYIRKDAHAAAEAMKDHNTTAENKYRDQASDASSVLHFRKTSGTPDWYKKKYGHMKESVDLDENVTNISDAKLKFHVLNGVPHGSYSKAEMKSEHDRRKKTRGPEYNSVKPSLNEAKTDVYHQHMLKALGKTKLPKDHPYTSAVANNGDFVVHNNGKVVGRLPKGEHSIKEESSLPPHLAKLIDPKTGNMKDPEKQKIYDDMMKRRQGMAKAKAKMAEETSSVAKDATVKSTKPNVTANTNTTTPYDVKPQRIKSAEFNKLHN